MSIAKQCQYAQTKPEKHEAFQRLYKEINRFQDANKMQELSDFMQDFSSHLTGMPGVFMVAVLRLTCLNSDEIESWRDVRDEIAKELESRGENSSQILEGLYEGH